MLQIDNDINLYLSQPSIQFAINFIHKNNRVLKYVKLKPFMSKIKLKSLPAQTLMIQFSTLG